MGIVLGNIKDDEGLIDAPIGRNPTDRKKWRSIIRMVRKPLLIIKCLRDSGDYTYLQFSLETGRTHQIRVHMASISHPLLGDMLYSNYSSSKSRFKICRDNASMHKESALYIQEPVNIWNFRLHYLITLIICSKCYIILLSNKF